jgi:hypothetical protein
MIRFAVLFTSCLFALSSMPAAANMPAYTYKTAVLHDVVINDYGKRPAPSGLLRTWLRVGVVENHIANLNVYVNYQGETQKLPAIGETCDITYHLGWIEGYFKPLQTADDRDRVVDEFACRSGTKVRIS